MMTMLASKLAAEALAAGVCPQAPPGMQHFETQITGWVKWGVLGLILLAAFGSIGTIVVGRVGHHPMLSRAGIGGLAITVMAAILYVVAPGILSGITGSGC